MNTSKSVSTLKEQAKAQAKLLAYREQLRETVVNKFVNDLAYGNPKKQ